jgi:hypothetical protein
LKLTEGGKKRQWVESSDPRSSLSNTPTGEKTYATENWNQKNTPQILPLHFIEPTLLMKAILSLESRVWISSPNLGKTLKFAFFPVVNLCKCDFKEI